MRLFISNSNGHLLATILFFSILGAFLVDAFYCSAGVPVYRGTNHSRLLSQAKKSDSKRLFIIGDSRTEAGIIPEIIDSITAYDAYNFGMEGIYRGYYDYVRSETLVPDVILMGVSPYAIFNEFQFYRENLIRLKLGKKTYSMLSILRKPNQYSEKVLNGFVNNHTRFKYGLAGIFDVLKFGKVSGYFSEKGWHGYDRLGSDEYYTYLINIESYKYKIIEQYRDSLKIDKGKRSFEELVKTIIDDGIDLIFVRIPTSSDLREIEDSKFPWFTKYLNEVSIAYGSIYIDLSDFNYPVSEIDGSHLNKESAKLYTQQLIKYIDN